MTKKEAIKMCKEILEYEELSLEVVTISPEDEDSCYFEKGEKVFRIIDDLCVNINNVEAERFGTLGGVMDRLDIYHKDYLEPFEGGGGRPDMLAFLKNDEVAGLLLDVSPEDYLASEVA